MPTIRKPKTLSSETAAGQLDSLIERLQKDPLPVMIHNTKEQKAVLISIEDYETLVEIADGLNRIEEGTADVSRPVLSDEWHDGRPAPLSDDYSEVLQFKITLEDVEPAIWRRIQMPANATFWDLHVAIQDAMGWEDAHMHTFECVHPEKGPVQISSVPIDDSIERRQEQSDWEVRLVDYFTLDRPDARYIYDFGDNWVHHVRLEDIQPRDDETEYPTCLDGRRACPPEDCGGPFGYHGLLEALDDAGGDEYQYWSDWIGEGFDPEHFSAAQIVFDDPEERWEDIFGNDDDRDDEWEEDWQEDFDRLQLLRLTREHMTKTWQRVRNDDLEDLTDEDLRIARIMQEHKEVLFDEFSIADLNPEYEFDPDSEVNPFLHITVHAIVEKQIEDREPIEAFQFFNAMRRKNCARHDAVHLVGLILTPLIFRVLKNSEPFDLPLYTALLTKYKHRNPARIPGLLENEPDWGFE
jgi:hypothetical protein